MNNLERYVSVFKELFDADKETLFKGFRYEDSPRWDSMGHLSLVANLEKEFGITMEFDDVEDFSSFRKGIEILRKYGVEISLKNLEGF